MINYTSLREILCNILQNVSSSDVMFIRLHYDVLYMINVEISTSFPEIDEIFKHVCNLAYEYAQTLDIANMSDVTIENDIDAKFYDEFIDEIYLSYSEEELAELLGIELTDNYDTDIDVIYDNLDDFVNEFYPGIGETVLEYL